MKKWVAVLFLLFIFGSFFFRKDIAQKYETQKRVTYNPYLSFEEVIKCYCGTGSEVITPYLRVVKLDYTENNTQYWILNTEDKKEVVLVNKIGNCPPLPLSANELVLVKGHVSFRHGKLNLDPTQGYIQYQGKDYCRAD